MLAPDRLSPHTALEEEEAAEPAAQRVFPISRSVSLASPVTDRTGSADRPLPSPPPDLPRGHDALVQTRSEAPRVIPPPALFSFANLKPLGRPAAPETDDVPLTKANGQLELAFDAPCGVGGNAENEHLRPKPETRLATGTDVRPVCGAEVDHDFKCPICLELIREAFISRYCCIVEHLQHVNSCPTCQTGLDKSQIYPNFLRKWS